MTPLLTHNILLKQVKQRGKEISVIQYRKL